LIPLRSSSTRPPANKVGKPDEEEGNPELKLRGSSFPFRRRLAPASRTASPSTKLSSNEDDTTMGKNERRQAGVIADIE